MKSSIFGMLFILIALTVGPLIYFNGGDKYLDKWLSSPAKPKLELNRDVVYAPVTTDEKVEIFKWKDENGVWQFGSTPPPGQQGVESMMLQPNVNVMKPVEVPEKEQATQSGSRVVRLNDIEPKRKTGKDDDSFGISKDSLENPYAPESVSELLDTTKNLQGVLNNRQQLQQSVGK